MTGTLSREIWDGRYRFDGVQSLSTNGARAVAPFLLDGEPHLAIPQLAADVPGQAPGVNAGRSDQPVIVYRWRGEGFEERFRLASTGGEDVEAFRIGGQLNLAIANLRSGSGPYDLNVDSELLRWTGDRFVTHQRFPTFAAKQWRHVAIGERHFLALAQGVEEPGARARNPDQSTIYEWTGDRFEPFQEVPSRWGYNWHHFRVAGMDLLGYLDHMAPSCLLRWTGTAFDLFQELDGEGGRALCAFQADGDTYLAYARLPTDTVLLRWNGGRFDQVQALSGPGGREFAAFENDGVPCLLQVSFLTGSREQPSTRQRARLYRWGAGKLHEVGGFDTNGATDACVLDIDGRRLIAVSESLSPDVRFRIDSHIYALGVAGTPRGAR